MLVSRSHQTPDLSMEPVPRVFLHSGWMQSASGMWLVRSVATYRFWQSSLCSMHNKPASISYKVIPENRTVALTLESELMCCRSIQNSGAADQEPRGSSFKITPSTATCVTASVCPVCCVMIHCVMFRPHQRPAGCHKQVRTSPRSLRSSL